MELAIPLVRETVDWTISRLMIDARFECFTLEDEARVVKVSGETRIGVGRFSIGLRTEGPMHERYLQRFGPAFHKGMLWIMDVPRFEFVYFHIGNSDDDTRACVLVGERWVESGRLIGSERAYRRFYPKVAGALLCGEPAWLTVTR